MSLTDPSVDLNDSPDIEFAWAEKIISCLFRNQRNKESLFFFNSTLPALWSENLVTLMLKTLCKVDLLQAISFQQKHGHGNANSYFKMILDEAFTRNYN